MITGNLKSIKNHLWEIKYLGQEPRDWATGSNKLGLKQFYQNMPSMHRLYIPYPAPMAASVAQWIQWNRAQRTCSLLRPAPEPAAAHLCHPWHPLHTSCLYAWVKLSLSKLLSFSHGPGVCFQSHEEWWASICRQPLLWGWLLLLMAAVSTSLIRILRHDSSSQWGDVDKMRLIIKPPPFW